MLDEAELFDAKIVVSDGLDEYKIAKLIENNAPIDSFGVGESLITAKSAPVFGGVYKLVAEEINNEIIPAIKISDTEEKITNPHFKKVLRLYKNNKIFGDALVIYNEEKPVIKIDNEEIVLDKNANFEIKEITSLFMEDGIIKAPKVEVEAVRERVKSEIKTIKDENLDLFNAEKLPVFLSEKLLETKIKLINNI